MANEQNLQPQNMRTKSEQREIAIKGGKASGAARRRKKTLREELLFLLEQKQTDKNGKKHTTQEYISLALIQQAARGNTKAFEIIRDTIGEKPEETVNVNAPDMAVMDEVRRRMEGARDDP